MTPTWQTAAGVLVADLQTVFGDRLRSVVAYGPRVEGDEDSPLSCLALVASLEAGDLEKCARLADRWGRADLSIPLVVPEREFRRSLDAFPLEYGEIIRAHERVHGDDPFTGIAIAIEDLRRACELQARSHLLHLRERFIETGGRPAAVGTLVAASAPGFTALLRNVARLSGVNTSDRVEATRSGGRAAGVADAMVTDMLNLERQPGIPATDPSRLFPEYLAAVERLSQAVDRWHDA
jgi:hypothetical protein